MIKKIIVFTGCIFIALSLMHINTSPLGGMGSYQVASASDRCKESSQYCECLDFLARMEKEDFSLYEVYAEYPRIAIEHLYWVSAYTGTDQLISYRPEPDDIIRLKEIASNMPESERKDYIQNTFGNAVSVIVGGSSDLPIDSILYFAHLASQLNQPFYIINNNRHSKFSRESSDLVISEFSLDIRGRINNLIANNRQRDQNIWVDIKSASELEQAIGSILAEADWHTINLFIVTHGTENNLMFSTVCGKDFTVNSTELVSILDNQAEVNLFLGTCYSNIFAQALPDKSINVVSASDKVLVDGDLAVSLLMALKNEDFRVTPEELKAISEGSMADGEDQYCYYYQLGGRRFRIIDHKVSWAHKVRFGYKQSELNIEIRGFEDQTSLLYFQVGIIP